MKTWVRKLLVKYNGRIVGYLAELDGGEFAFQYDDAWIRDGFSISPFSLPLTNQVYINKKTTFKGIYGVFNDSLPDGWGELLVKRMLGKKGVNYDRLTPLTKLSLMSGSGLGALEYEPCQAEDSPLPDYSLDEIAADAKRILDDEDGEDIDFDKVFQLGGSSGGARPKAHIKDGEEYWIVKFPCRIDPKDIGKAEYTANAMAKKCGINVNEFKLFKSAVTKGYFGAKRFDRIGEKRIHTVSLSALLETTHRIPNLDYLHLFQVIQNISIDKNDMLEAYRRMCFNVFYGNKDDHGKNHAFIYDDEAGGYRLSPAFDLTKTPHKPEHEMTVKGSGIPTENDLLETAKNIKLPMEECKKIVAEIKRTVKRSE